MHDMHLEVMVSKSLESNFLSLHGRRYKGILYDKIHHLTLLADVENVDFVAKGNVEGHYGEDNLNMQHVPAPWATQAPKKARQLRPLEGA